MTTESPRADAPSPLPATLDEAPAPPPPDVDENGFDRSDYEWYPVLRKPRADGWTPSRQRDFIEALADIGSVKAAAEEIGMTERSCYRLRRAPGGEGFARAWDAAIEAASRRLADMAFERAMNGVIEPVFNKYGECIATRRRYNDRLLMFLLRAHLPDRYRHANRDVVLEDETPPPPALPVAEALARLAPQTPAAPELTCDVHEMDARFAMADIMEGDLPYSHIDRPLDLGRRAEEIDPAFEYRLDCAKGERTREKPYAPGAGDPARPIKPWTDLY